MPIKITTNRAQFLAALIKKSKVAEKKLEEIMLSGAYVVEATAIARAPRKVGNLRQNMFVQEIDNLTYEIGNNLKYAAYQEFGTRYHASLKNIPEELKELAIMFKADPLIKATNIPAWPFLYPGLIAGRQYIGSRLENDFKDLK